MALSIDWLSGGQGIAGRPAGRRGRIWLVLVDRLTRRWGVERGPGSTTVWFELAD